MTADTPTPYTPPDGVILTTMAEARRVGHGQAISATRAPEVHRNWELRTDLSQALSDERVWWRPTPELTVTIELPESEVRRIADTCWWSETGDDVVHEAARAAVARLDGDT